jgi:large subunit ribosomal protein L24
MVAKSYRSKIKKNDLVMVITGRDRGKTGKVMRVIPDRQRVLVERINVVKRHSKPRGAASPGGIVEKEAPIHVSNVMLMDERSNGPTRVGYRVSADGEKLRISRRSGETIGDA